MFLVEFLGIIDSKCICYNLTLLNKFPSRFFTKKWRGGGIFKLAKFIIIVNLKMDCQENLQIFILKNIYFKEYLVKRY